jgi:signal transduction histidine kinase
VGASVSEPLHQFMAKHRDDLLRLCLDRMRKLSPGRSDSELCEGFRNVLDEVIAAVERELESASGATAELTESAAQFGVDRQRRDFAIGNLAMHLGTISDSLGELGARQGKAFEARDYQAFNRCLDTTMAAAIDEFFKKTQSQEEIATTERIGFLAHELRNALHSAKMSFAMIRNGQFGIHSRTADVLDRSLARLDSLVAQILVSARLRSGVEPEREWVEVEPMLRDIADATTAERGIRIHVIADRELAVIGDQRLLVTALSNLVQNAVKFSHRHATVEVRARRDGPMVVIEVEDECGGLPEGKPDELFAPHVQRGNDRRGFGFGLPITREAVEAQRGEIFVRNLPGKGCVFVVRLLGTPHAEAIPRE